MPGKKRGLSFDEKCDALHKILLEQDSFFTLKEIEKLVRDKHLFPVPVVKSIVQAIVADNRLHSDKVGCQTLYWIFKSENAVSLSNRKEKALKEMEETKQQLEELSKTSSRKRKYKLTKEEYQAEIKADEEFIREFQENEALRQKYSEDYLNDMLKEIEVAFNNMAEKLDRLMQDIKLLSGGLSHELRTPLARVRMGLDTLCETNDPRQKEQFEIRINQNLDDMEALVHALLNFARLQHTLDSTLKTELDLNLLLKQQVEKANDPRCKLKIQNSPCYIKAETHFINLLLSNLLNNAFKYAQKRIELECKQDNDFTYLMINDDGDGIAPEDREKVLKPFIRLNKKNHNLKAGYGIGLALVERIVSWIDGQINIETSKNLGGASFIIKIPRN